MYCVWFDFYGMCFSPAGLNDVSSSNHHYSGSVIVTYYGTNVMNSRARWPVASIQHACDQQNTVRGDQKKSKRKREEEGTPFAVSWRRGLSWHYTGRGGGDWVSVLVSALVYSPWNRHQLMLFEIRMNFEAVEKLLISSLPAVWLDKWTSLGFGGQCNLNLCPERGSEITFRKVPSLWAQNVFQETTSY